MTYPLISADISFFSLEMSNFKKYRYRLHFDTWFLALLTFFESFNIFLINLVKILMMSAKMATLVPLKTMVFWSKGYDVIISVDDVTNILWHYSNYIVDVFMWPKFGNSSISIREVISTSILWGLDQKNLFFLGVVLVQVQ